jgi:phosphotransferase system  glucose/maltose/N-acetylglucosamine-specific IIC component
LFGGGKKKMILGMDGGVFAAWILTIIAAIACVIYGIYYEFLKKDEEEKTPLKKDKKQKEEGE